jgi:hypothetical protein
MNERGDFMSLTPKCDMFLKNALAFSSPSDTFPRTSNTRKGQKSLQINQNQPKSGQCNAVEIVEVRFVFSWVAKTHGVVWGCLISQFEERILMITVYPRLWS